MSHYNIITIKSILCPMGGEDARCLLDMIFEGAATLAALLSALWLTVAAALAFVVASALTALGASFTEWLLATALAFAPALSAFACQRLLE